MLDLLEALEALQCWWLEIDLGMMKMSLKGSLEHLDSGRDRLPRMPREHNYRQVQSAVQRVHL